MDHVMNDVDGTQPEEPMPGDARQDVPRDERIAALLEVEPLDEVTRRRMVSRATREAHTPLLPSRKFLLVAASFLLVLAVVGGITASRTGEHPVALRATTQPSGNTAASPSAGSTADARGATTFAAGARDLGDYGNL